MVGTSIWWKRATAFLGHRPPFARQSGVRLLGRWGREHEHWADTDVLNASVPANLWGRGEIGGPWGEAPPERFMHHATP